MRLEGRSAPVAGNAGKVGGLAIEATKGAPQMKHAGQPEQAATGAVLDAADASHASHATGGASGVGSGLGVV